ncbi:hypothetical protein H8R05_07585, partial [Anaerotruncus massiliensis]|nr:hypothetical protein [Anaerotruncus massiliensis (ex Togo et al. 2019)]
MKRLLSGFLAALMLLCAGLPAMAEELPEEKKDEPVCICAVACLEDAPNG